ncbi:MAG: phospholipase D-like domain-containing protein [Candidatus Bilamarchaeaceae archaeon]
MNRRQFLYLLIPFCIALGFILGFFAHGAFYSLHIVVSPENGREILDFIDGARQSLDVEVYFISSTEVTNALIEAKRRGVDVRVIVDRGPYKEENTWVLERLSAAGIPVKFGVGYKTYHTKFIIRDGTDVLVGSHNLSHSALYQNREVSLILRNTLADEFMKIFEEDWQEGVYASISNSFPE